MNGQWSKVVLAGHPADVYDPAVSPRFGVLFLHGADQAMLGGRTSFTRLFDELRVACISPHGKLSWWADRPCAAYDPNVTAERHLLDLVFPHFRERWGLGSRSVGLLGVCMGGQGALRLAFKHPQTFPAVASIAPAIDCHELYGLGSPLDDMYDSKEQCRQDTALLHIHPSRQPAHVWFSADPEDREWYRGVDRLHEKMSALGATHTCDLKTRAGGHTWAYYESKAEESVRFLVGALEQEARKLL